MIRVRKGKVKEIIKVRPGCTELLVEVEGREELAINYDALTGQAIPGDEVFLNTTAVTRGLGSGGYHFVICIPRNESLDPAPAGHIMKLRYTPFQVKCLCAEEEESPYRLKIEGFRGLDGMPVIVGELHSMLPPAAAAVKALTAGKARVAYIMTDGGALPIALSATVDSLKRVGLLDATITVGHAFGGEYEAVNLYSGLVIAKSVAEADVAVVAMGPGIVGTATRYGFTGAEQGEAINAVNILGGTAILIPRISFQDPRERHHGISHHTITVLKELALTPAIVSLPELSYVNLEFIRKQLRDASIPERHIFAVEKGDIGLKFLEEKGIEVKSMGRASSDDPAFFLASGAAGVLAARLIAPPK